MQRYTDDSPTTDFGNVRRFLSSPDKDDLLFDCFRGVWYAWDTESGYWKEDASLRRNSMMKNMVRGINNEVAALDAKVKEMPDETSEEKEKKESKNKFLKDMRAWAHGCQNHHRIDGCLMLLRDELTTSTDKFDTAPNLFNFTNGTLDLDTMKFSAHDKKHLITMSCGWDYDKKAKCPKWEAFIDDLFKSHPHKNDLIRFLRMVLGYCLTGNTDHQVFIILTGGGGTGKSVLIATLVKTFGDYGMPINGSSFTLAKARVDARGDLAVLKGKRFVGASEVDRGEKLDVQLIKSLTGGSGESIRVRFMYKEDFSLYPTFKVFWSFNDPPKVGEISHALFRRLRVLPFNEIIGEDDRRGMAEILSEHDAERSGILNWLIAGYQDLKATGNLDWCEAVKVATAELKSDVDYLSTFFDTLEFGGDPKNPLPSDFGIKASDLYDHYRGWAIRAGVKFIMTQKMLGSEMNTRFGKGIRHHTNHGDYYRGVRIHNGEDCRCVVG
jgi:putative DNA primase/helicase